MYVWLSASVPTTAAALFLHLILTLKQSRTLTPLLASTLLSLYTCMRKLAESVQVPYKVY